MRSAGITRIEGDVAIDNRLWQPDPQLQQFDPGLDPMIINDNVIDVRVRPTAPGKPAKVFWRPQTAAIRVTGHRSRQAGARAIRARTRTSGESTEAPTAT